MLQCRFKLCTTDFAQLCVARSRGWCWKCSGLIRLEVWCSKTDPAIHYEAVVAVGNWEVEAAWPHISGLLASESTDKPLLPAAIGAVPTIRPHEAEEILDDLLGSDDEDIIDAVQEALAMAKGLSDDAAWNDDDEAE
jgi:hypothetical protein